ncbi:hypothetical protein [Burkholderia pseudomallei]|uniref:hypothetical protein n=1 Tax=Burkholderia pseudomallei TaxID=28450 RepID=UPI000AB05610|nr:hypothetical protein [Burkholderia pseudomallei]
MLPKTSKKLRCDEMSKVGTEYPLAIALALKREMGDSRRTIKTLTRWTGASERTVQNWLSAVRGPSGPHLVALAKHSTAVHEAYLSLTGRSETSTPQIEMSVALLREALGLLGGNG